MYVWKIEEMHQKYGPIVRINPWELHIADSDFYEEIYATSISPRNKFEWHQKAAQAHGVIGHTVDYRLHKIRKDSMSPFFSKRSVKDREQKIYSKIGNLCDRIREPQNISEPINLTAAYLALCTDIITQYAFGESYNLLKQQAFNMKWRDTILAIVKSVASMTHLPWLPAIIRILPTPIAHALFPDISQLLEYEMRVRDQVQAVLSFNGVYTHSFTSTTSTNFEELRDHPRLPASEKQLQRLTDEGNVLLIAASETPAKVLALISYHLFADNTKLQRLRDEILSLETKGRAREALPPLSALESLPYLTAVIREGLRLHGGILARSQRISPDRSLKYGKYSVPPGTPISCISYFMHYNPDIFPNPKVFNPERWLGSDQVYEKLTKNLVPFGRGTRSCLGYNLAWTELYGVISAIVTRFDLELFETNNSDVEVERDWFIPQPKYNSKGVQVIIRKCF